MTNNLPPIKTGEKVEFPHFPTTQQAVIFRNWEMISASRLAEVLHANESDIHKMAFDMGLTAQNVNPDWLIKGYITIIRQNWHLLPYEQLEQLLDWDEEKLEFVLKEDDFLSHKLGMIKPDTPPVFYRPLTANEQSRTAQIKEWIASAAQMVERDGVRKSFDFGFESLSRIENPKQPPMGSVCLDETWQILYDKENSRLKQYVSDFIDDFHTVTGVLLGQYSSEKQIVLVEKDIRGVLPESHTIHISENEIIITAVDTVGLLRGLIWLVKTAVENGGAFFSLGETIRETRFKLRITYSYCAIYGDCTDDLLDCSYPDALLKSYAYAGINGIWLQALLYKLTVFPFKPSISEGYEGRIKAIGSLIDRAARYGIKVYLYLNEPRSMPEEFFEEYPHLKGVKEYSFYSLCTSAKEVQEYLQNGVADVTRKLSGLGGYITITMSENLTNCYSRMPADKISCPRCKKRTQYEVAAEVNKLIAEGAWKANPSVEILAWMWGWSGRESIDQGITLMPQSVRIMATSEEAAGKDIGGVHTEVIDYSISIPGPGEKTMATFETAKKLGHPTAAKVQFNNTWECSAVPYIPTFDLVLKHLNGLDCTDALMLGWTLGGYPTATFKMIADSYFSDSAVDSHTAIKKLFSDKADIVEESQKLFCKAFYEFPFHISTLYVAPQNYGPSNLFYYQKTGWRATMIGYPYDDVESWRAIFPMDIFLKQWEKLCCEWKNGVACLGSEEGNKEYATYCQVANACYCHFKSTYNALQFTLLRDQKESFGKILQILSDEYEITYQLYELCLANPCIGYEASNHYFYSKNTLMEKMINVRWLQKKYALER